MQHASLCTVSLALALLALPLTACDDDDGPSYRASCQRNCERLHSCVSSTNVESCSQDCEETWAEVGPNLRADYLSGIDKCVAELSCNELAVASLTEQCPRESKARIGASPSALELCEAVAESVRDCTGLTVGTAGCIENVKIFSDRALRSASSCAEQACDRRAACVSDALGVDLF